ncbi:hypothetical protein M9Y10_022644 [Tritrichomonas musculus]|uniref:Uncharacterized protein n=1 Tax=Tritrichomonas musculus TaxID=1915356 RepID=A0ABR2KTT0_9EUKA
MEFHLKEFRYIKNQELLEAIKVEQNKKMNEEHLSKDDFFLGIFTLFEVDPEKKGNAFAFNPIFKKNKLGRSEIGLIAHLVVPIYIPNTQNIKEIINNFISNKSFQFKLFTPIILYTLYDEIIEIDRYIPIYALIYSIKKFIDVNEDDIIYNITPPEGFTYGVFVIHESNKNGHTYKTLFDITDMKNAKIIKTNLPKEEINSNKNNNDNDNLISMIPKSKKHPIHKKFKKGIAYTKLE